MTAVADQTFVQALLDVEVALAAAEADVGLVPASAVPHIEAAAQAQAFDLQALAEAALADGNALIPLVRRLTELVAARHQESAHFVHRGATSQDIIDTAVVLRLRDASATMCEQITTAMHAAARLARAHATTPMAGRTWLQQGSPTTFGLKAAGWLDLLGRARERVRESTSRAAVIQLGGATGTLAALGTHGPAVTRAMAQRLDLQVPDMPWHTHRDRLVEVATSYGIACGAFGKVGRDLTLLAQSEVGEATESGGGGSSSMPHKQNPVRAVLAVSAATRAPGLVSTMLAAMPQEHERAAGGWQAEWQTLADLSSVTIESATAIASALGALTVNVEAMRRNLALNGGVAMAESLSAALAPHVGRRDAMALVERLCRLSAREGRSLQDVARADAEVTRWFSGDEVARILAPDSFLGSSSVFVDRVLHRWSE